MSAPSKAEFKKHVEQMYPQGFYSDEKKVELYLDRMQFFRSSSESAPAPYITQSVQNLQELVRSHIHTFPFENVDMHRNIPYLYSIDALFHKLVLSRRGAFCYEQITLFQWLLNQLGYKAFAFQAGVNMALVGGQGFAKRNHLALMVIVPQEDNQCFLVDIAFGAAPLCAIPLQLEVECSGADKQRWKIAKLAFNPYEGQDSEKEWSKGEFYALYKHAPHQQASSVDWLNAPFGWSLQYCWPSTHADGSRNVEKQHWQGDEAQDDNIPHICQVPSLSPSHSAGFPYRALVPPSAVFAESVSDLFSPQAPFSGGLFMIHMTPSLHMKMLTHWNGTYSDTNLTSFSRHSTVLSSEPLSATHALLQETFGVPLLQFQHNNNFPLVVQPGGAAATNGCWKQTAKDIREFNQIFDECYANKSSA